MLTRILIMQEKYSDLEQFIKVDDVKFEGKGKKKKNKPQNKFAKHVFEYIAKTFPQKQEGLT